MQALELVVALEWDGALEVILVHTLAVLIWLFGSDKCRFKAAQNAMHCQQLNMQP